ncbi:MAG: hypothetical protein J1E61_09120 [Lachnospiraceae bacterium]|nr:hypothetical protein [Lachnospiraceae bacterium]
MSEKKQYAVGIDLGKKYAQISYRYLSGEEGEITHVPLCLCKRIGANQWFYGEEAQRFAASGKGILIENFYGKDTDRGDDGIMVEEKEMERGELLWLFVRHCLSRVLPYKENAEGKSLVITVESLTEPMLHELRLIKQKLQDEFEEISFEPRMESLFHYVVHQPKELQSYETCVVDFSHDHLEIYRVEMKQKTRPVLTSISKQVYTNVNIPRQFGSIKDKDAYMAKLDEKMEDVLNGFMEGRIVTSAYLTGKALEKEWYPETIKLLCRNRRVFLDSVLYAKGACLGALSRLGHGESEKGYLYLGEGKLKEHIGVVDMEQGKQTIKILMEGGCNWFEAKTEFLFMPGEDGHLPIVLKPLNGAKERIVPLVLPDRKERDLKSLRYRCSLSMKSERELLVQVEDVGFGEFYGPSGKRYEEVILLGGGL